MDAFGTLIQSFNTASRKAITERASILTRTRSLNFRQGSNRHAPSKAVDDRTPQSLFPPDTNPCVLFQLLIYYLQLQPEPLVPFALHHACSAAACM
jgi:hypothetical protein